MILPPSFYTRSDVVQIARELLGKILVTHIDGIRTAGMITETEAYAGPTDKACHAFLNRRTNRTEPMFAGGGIAYIYLCYGIHHLFNIVTHSEGEPYAVLVRAVEPVEGIGDMLLRRGATVVKPALTAGPGAMSAALGIHRKLSGASLQGPEIYIEDRGIMVPPKDIIAGTRVGIAYAQEDALLPYRFSLPGNPFVSKAKGL